MTGLLLVVALVAAIIAVVFFFQFQSASGAVLGLRREADAARKEAEGARAELRKAQEEARQQKALLAETREKLTDARKKAQETRGAKPQQARSTRESELEEDLQHARKLAEDAHAAESAARKERDEARASEQRAKAELEKTLARVRELQARPQPAPVVAAPVESPPEVESIRKELESKQAAFQQELAGLRDVVKEAKKREQDLREDVRRYRGRAETNNRVYLVTKGELDVLKERLAHAERKLWQAGIPIAPPEKKDRPRATGPAAADRSRDAGGERPHGDAPAQDDSASHAGAELAAQPSPEMPTAASVPAPESIPAPVEPAVPQAVAPIRRRAEGAGADLLKPE